jgi:hypothetical protein
MESQGRVSVSEGGQCPVVVASGHVVRGAAQELVAALERLEPEPCPQITVDLRGAFSVDPVVVHALLHAWERRQRRPDSVRVLVIPGPVQRFLDMLGLEHALDVVHPGDEPATPLPVLAPAEWQAAREGALEHYQHLLAAARVRDVEQFAAAARLAHPLCVAAGAPAGGLAFGEHCSDCPLRKEYGGCQPLLAQATRAAERGNWDAAQLLLLALIAQVAGMPEATVESQTP